MKKQFFTTAIAFIAALSLSASAFAADAPGDSIGDSIGASEGVGTAIVGTDNAVSAVVDENMTLSIEVSDTLFPGYAEIKLEVGVSDASKDNAAILALDEVLSNIYHNTSVAKIFQKLEITLTGRKAGETEFEAVQPARSVRVTFTAQDNAANAVVDPENISNRHGLLELVTNLRGTSHFNTTHFSTYYTAQVAQSIWENRDDEDNNNNNGGGILDPGDNNGGSSDNNGGSSDNNGGSSDNNGGSSDNNGGSSDNNGGSNDNNGGSNNNNNNGSNDNNGGSNNNNGGSNDNNGGSSDNNGGSSDNNGNTGNGNTGDTNTGNGSDKNQATGVVLAVVPAAIAAAAVVISKKRK